jgi:membrane complex biogenesis BtpA family protein
MEKSEFLKQLFGVNKPVFGMVHFLPLPGSPLYDRAGGIQKIREQAFRDAEVLVRAGFDGLMFSNEGDRPYLSQVEKFTVAFMTELVGTISKEFKKPFGVSVLADPQAAIAVGTAVGATFVRIFLSWVFVSDWGIVNPDAGTLQRYKASIDSPIKIFANISGHTAPLGGRRIFDIARGAIKFGLADAISLAGSTAGSEVPEEEIDQALQAALDEVPVVIGTGVSLTNIERLFPKGDAFIVGTSLKYNGDTFSAIDPSRATLFMNKVHSLRKG